MPTALAKAATRPPAGQTLASPLGRVTSGGVITYDGPRPRWPKMRVFGAYATVYVYEGGGYYDDANGLRHAVAAGDLILVFPDLPHCYVPGDGGWSELFLVFEGAAFDLWTTQG